MADGRIQIIGGKIAKAGGKLATKCGCCGTGLWCQNCGTGPKTIDLTFSGIILCTGCLSWSPTGDWWTFTTPSIDPNGTWTVTQVDEGFSSCLYVKVIPCTGNLSYYDNDTCGGSPTSTKTITKMVVRLGLGIGINDTRIQYWDDDGLLMGAYYGFPEKESGECDAPFYGINWYDSCAHLGYVGYYLGSVSG